MPKVPPNLHDKSHEIESMGKASNLIWLQKANEATRLNGTTPTVFMLRLDVKPSQRAYHTPPSLKDTECIPGRPIDLYLPEKEVER
jgi:hypothetical protein